MIDFEQILKDIPDHEQRANNFMAEISISSDFLRIKAKPITNINPPQKIVDELEKELPGIKDDIFEDAHEMEIESITKSVIIVNIETNEKSLLNEALINVKKAAQKYSGTENDQVDARNMFSPDFIIAFSKRFNLNGEEIINNMPKFWKLMMFEFV